LFHSLRRFSSSRTGPQQWLCRFKQSDDALWFARKTDAAIISHLEKQVSRMFAFSQSAKRAAFRFRKASVKAGRARHSVRAD
jgi:hypothetical protein